MIIIITIIIIIIIIIIGQANENKRFLSNSCNDLVINVWNFFQMYM